MYIWGLDFWDKLDTMECIRNLYSTDDLRSNRLYNKEYFLWSKQKQFKHLRGLRPRFFHHISWHMWEMTISYGRLGGRQFYEFGNLHHQSSNIQTWHSGLQCLCQKYQDFAKYNTEKNPYRMPPDNHEWPAMQDSDAVCTKTNTRRDFQT